MGFREKRMEIEKRYSEQIKLLEEAKAKELEKLNVQKVESMKLLYNDISDGFYVTNDTTYYVIPNSLKVEGHGIISCKIVILTQPEMGERLIFKMTKLFYNEESIINLMKHRVDSVPTKVHDTMIKEANK